MYQVLYRKWRPHTFDDVAGQAHITSTLAGAVTSGRPAHAYLFTGSRGTGKTTCAKILAKAVNCLHPQNGSPCNECEICKGIDSGAVMDVIEIDAASNNGVDNIRDLREEANFTPSAAKYRVYIIDEVHMLSIGAFNALLKTLEEPPAHVIFILATTEVHKLPATILSRCQRFDFGRIPADKIAERVTYVANEEHMEIEPAAASLIARIADGALRDALGLLDRCGSYNAPITEKLVADAAGIAGREHIFALADAIAAKDSAKAMELLHTLYESACDMEQLLLDLSAHLRNLLITATVKNYADLIVCSASELARLCEQKAGFTAEALLHAMDVLMEAGASMKTASSRRTVAEVTLLRLCNPSLDTDSAALLRRIAELERQVRVLSQGGATLAVQQTAPEKATEPRPEPAKASVRQTHEEIPLPAEPSAEKPAFVPPARESAPSPAAKKPAPLAQQLQNPNAADGNTGDIPFDSWGEVVELLTETDRPLVGLLSGSGAFIHGGFLLIQSPNPLLEQFLRTGNHASLIAQAAYRVSGKKFKLGIYNNPAASASAPKADPLSGLMDKARALGIQINTEEQ